MLSLFPPRVVEKLPGQRGQFGRLNAQLDPQPRALTRGHLTADVVATLDFTGEQGVKENAAEVLHRLLGAAQPASRRAAGPQQRVLEFDDVLF